jgi:ADP-ribose pyrophosphatase YjhB (NUDIX family)
MNLLKLINLENTTEQEANAFFTREAARAIVFDSENLVALLHSKKFNYYKLPGGGIEKGEDYETALKRECQEEIGCSVEVLDELGMIVEYRRKYTLKQTSYCYTAKVIGEKGISELTADEIAEEFETVWLPLEEAIQKVKNNNNLSVYEVPYMVTRDTTFLETCFENKK